MAQIRSGHALRAIGVQARATSRAAGSPRASPSFATSHVSSSPRNLIFTSRLSTSTSTSGITITHCLRTSRQRRCAPTQILRTQGFHTTTNLRQESSDRSFTDLKNIDPKLLDRVTGGLKHTSLTPLQGLATELLSPDRRDAILHASSGSGKTLAYLLPALQRCIEEGYDNGAVSAAIVVPSREQAEQVYEQVKVLMQDHPKHVVRFVHGEQNKEKETRNLLYKADIIVATAGRLLQHARDETTSRIFRHVHTIVVDDADRSLDMGFSENLAELLQRIPKERTTIQTILACANKTPELEKFADAHCRPGFKTISAPLENEAQLRDSRQHELVEVPDFPSVTSGLAAYVKEEIASGKPFKAVVFAPTFLNIDLYQRLLGRQKGMPPVLPVHSKKTPGQRLRNSKVFRDAESAILLATDGFARGLSFPGVTHVIHAGVPRTKVAYGERIKQTVPGGQSVLLLAEPEKKFVTNVLGDVDFTPRAVDPKSSASGFVFPYRHAAGLYRSWLANYSEVRKELEWSDEELVRHASAFVKPLGAKETPGIYRSVVDKIGLNPDTPGLVISKEDA